jgi:broad specificity phosphatase PhoE
MNMKLYFETHSTSVDNELGRASGHLDVDLSETGRVQAGELGARYASRALGVVYTSDLRRASAAAAIAFAARNLALVQDRRLRECDYGTWSGCSVQQLEPVRARFIDEPFPGGESYRDAVRRVEAFLNELDGNAGPVLLVGHRATWYALEHLLAKRDLAEVVASPWKWQPGWQYEL